MNIEKLIASLQNEILKTQTGIQQTQSLERLKSVAKSYNGEDKIVSFASFIEKVKANINKVKIFSGFSNLDSIIKGFRLKQVVVVSGVTKHGKTTWVMDLTSKMIDQHPLWFPLEESAEELIEKYIERGEEPPEMFTPLSYASISLNWIESKIIESIAKNNTKVVVIDQLDFIVPQIGDNHHLRVAQTMRDLKDIAKRLDIVIFILCHLTKVKIDTQPTLEDLKGSSSIGGEADTVILVWRETKRENGEVIITNNTNISVQANRKGGTTGNIKMVFDNGHYHEQDWVSEHSNLANF